jgi:hypothetical protein
VLQSVTCVEQSNNAEMADVGISARQIVVTEFLIADSSSPVEIHRRLTSVYGEDAMDVSSVTRWVRFLRAEKRTVVTGPAAADPRQGCCADSG